MKILLVLTIACLLFTAGVSGSVQSSSNPNAKTPVLVELFTSEGCSSCPPADALLQKLDRQPIAGEQMIVLSEHVDYWNHIGWKDPYSSRFYSDRQSAYARRLGLSDVYTPQMIVDGISEFVGSDEELADKAFAKALAKPKIAVSLSSVSIGSANVLQAHLVTGALPESNGLRAADVYVAIALNHAESHVSHGENAGRTLAHTAVVRSIVKVGTLRQGRTLAQNIQLRLDPGTDTHNLRLIAFVQEPGQGRVIGAAKQTVDAVVAVRN
ncbi:MAG TPA: DUF1223 domain-containing protein [Terriglobales bacterium]|nr:DUF1223 domain-containing protein [Terriglobales bacterium]